MMIQKWLSIFSLTGTLSEVIAFYFHPLRLPLTIKPETVTVMDRLGSPVYTASSTAMFEVTATSPNFPMGSNEMCYEVGLLGPIAGSQHVDFTVIGTANGVSAEIKLSYIEPLM